MSKVQEIYRIYNLISSCACILSRFSCVGLCDPMECGLPGSCPWDSPGKNIGVGCPGLPPGDLRDPGIKPVSLTSPALADSSIPMHMQKCIWIKKRERWGNL